MAINTYVALDSATLSTAGVVEFTSIPSTYTDLVVVASNLTSTSSTPGLCMRFNGDTGSNYQSVYAETNNVTAYGTNLTTNTYINSAYQIGMSATSTNPSSVTFNIMSYANNKWKSVLGRTDIPQSSQPGVGSMASVWRNTDAITSIQLNAQGSNIATGTFSLYGIKAWTNTESSPKATGGYVYSDATYWYHAFPFSSTFTPNTTLTADILVIAGGGAGGTGGDRGAGGGGAGGLLAFTSQALTATTYTCTVGAGGAAGAGGGSYLRGSNGGNSQFGALTSVIGGGAGGTENSTLGAGLSGGSGGGGGGSLSGAGTGGANTSGQGFAGGNGFNANSIAASGGGGGGAGAAGANAGSSNPTAGGVGVTTYSSWGIATQTGENVSGTVYYAGGGAGAGGALGRSGGLGGGGASFATSTPGTSGLSTTGGGGGGNSLNANPGSGGSGIVIVRYAK